MPYKPRDLSTLIDDTLIRIEDTRYVIQECDRLLASLRGLRPLVVAVSEPQTGDNASADYSSSH